MLGQHCCMYFSLIYIKEIFFFFQEVSNVLISFILNKKSLQLLLSSERMDLYTLQWRAFAHQR